MIVVNAPVEAPPAPIAVASIAPPSMLTALAFCVAIVPVPADTLASAGWGTDEDYGCFDNGQEW